ncbi:MAG: DUF6938 domain-containing protein [Candidatus Aminicenantia bacterium]
MSVNSNKKAWIISADMGLGHQRAAYPLKDIAEGGIINAGDPGIISEAEFKFWKRVRSSYEFLSRSQMIPLIGNYLFKILDKIQNIKPLYPKRDLSSPTLQTYYLSYLIKKGLGSEILKLIKEKELPIITTFYVPALVADYRGYQGKIYCVICDSDINRVWASSTPSSSRINYFVPCESALKRLKRYGVSREKIFLTGFPLPKENIGSRDNREILKIDLLDRLHHLDIKGRFFNLHKSSITFHLGPNIESFRKRLLTITFAIGGAGAQSEIGMKLIKSFRDKLLDKEVAINISVGVRKNLQIMFTRYCQELGLSECIDRNLRIIYHPNKFEYFAGFNELLRTTDILWTKPSELTFYCGLGIPIIIAPPIGAHELANMKWLLEVHAGILQEDPEYAKDWILDWLVSGRFAEAAWDGYLKAPKMGTFIIEDIVQGKKIWKEIEAVSYDTTMHLSPFSLKKNS